MIPNRRRPAPSSGLYLALVTSTLLAACTRPTSPPEPSSVPAMDSSLASPGGPGALEVGGDATAGGTDIADPTRQAIEATAVSPKARAELGSLIVDALRRGELEIVATSMGDPFQIALWRSEGRSLPPREAAEELAIQHLPNPEALEIVDPQPDLAALLDGTDPTALWGPEVDPLSALLTRGWGPEGQGEAMLILARHPSEARAYWHALLLAPLGFDRPLP